MATRTNTRRNSANGSKSSNGSGRRTGQRKAAPKPENDYEEEAGWGSAFNRPDNEAPQPTYTGTGMLDRETAKAIIEAGGEFQISVWPRRARTGTKYLRFHIEPPYAGGSDDADLDDDDFDGPAGDDQEADDDDDMPF